MTLSELSTPALVLDNNKLMANITRMQTNADRLGPDEGTPEAKLPEEARGRIKAALRNGEG